MCKRIDTEPDLNIGVESGGVLASTRQRPGAQRPSLSTPPSFRHRRSPSQLPAMTLMALVPSVELEKVHFTLKRA